MINKKYKDMGMVVMVTKALLRKQNSDKIVWLTVAIAEAEQRPAWIVGWRIIQNGNIEYRGEAAGCGFKITASVPCMLVSYWPTMKPIHIPLDGYREWLTSDPIPFMKSSTSNKRAAVLAEKQLRDAKGLFV